MNIGDFILGMIAGTVLVASGWLLDGYLFSKGRPDK